MRLKKVLVTPALAKTWIEKDNRNKRRGKIRTSVVEHYADQMIRGLWRLTSETIKIDAEGYNLDGLHRLYAVVLSNMPVEMWVCFGEPSTTSIVCDGGVPRSVSDHTGLSRRYVEIASAWYQRENGKTTKRIVSDDLCAFSQRHDAAITWADNKRGHTRGISRAAVWTAIAMYWERNRSKAEAFAECLVGETFDVTQALRLRDFLLLSLDRHMHSAGGTAQRVLFDRAQYACEKHEAGIEFSRFAPSRREGK